MSAIRENSLRGRLLEFLRHLYPDGSDTDGLIAVFYPYHRDKDITTAIEYLADKNYVLRRQIPHPYAKARFVTLYKISASGIDLVDGATTDVGVTIVPEKS